MQTAIGVDPGHDRVGDVLADDDVVDVGCSGPRLAAREHRGVTRPRLSGAVTLITIDPAASPTPAGHRDLQDLPRARRSPGRYCPSTVACPARRTGISAPTGGQPTPESSERHVASRHSVSTGRRGAPNPGTGL